MRISRFFVASFGGGASKRTVAPSHHIGVADSGEFSFAIEYRPEGPGGCNWYPLANIEAWRGDLMRNLAAFRAVRDDLAARYNILAPAEAAGEARAPVATIATR